MEFINLIAAVEGKTGFLLEDAEAQRVMDMAAQAQAGVPMGTIRRSTEDSFEHFQIRNHGAANGAEREANLRRLHIATAVETVLRENGLLNEAA